MAMATKISKDYMKRWHTDKYSKCAIKQIAYERQKIGQLGLGYKTDSYFTEEEMIQGYRVPSYNELSESEKEIWKEEKGKYLEV